MKSEEAYYVKRNLLIVNNDYCRMPYVKAVMLENERMTPVAPIAGPRRVLKDISIGGYTLKKVTFICDSILRSVTFK